jgi:L-ascorbate metabolism protein UlaG (beta-lactamase superfamily)
MCLSFEVDRRQFIRGGAALAAGLASAGLTHPAAAAQGSLPGLSQGAETAPSSGGPGQAGVNFTWFGTNGWEITWANRKILIDPWFGRFDAGFFRPGQFNPQTPLTTNQDVLEAHIDRADQILVGHGHWDHVADLPQIAKKTGAMVVGSESHVNALLAAGVPAAQLVRVKGGENMQFDGYSIEVFPGLHSLGPTKQYNPPGHLYSVPTNAPDKVADLPEGDSLIYQITIGDTFRIFSMSTANYIERWLSGLQPDVALIASIFASSIHTFNERLLGALNYPKLILPTHWDNFEKPFSQGPQDLRDVFGDSGNTDLWVQQVKQISPQSQIVMLDFFQSYAP